MTILGVVMFVGAIAAFAAHAPVIVGGIFLALMVLCGAISVVFAAIFYNRAMTEQRKLRAEVEATFRHRPGDSGF